MELKQAIDWLAGIEVHSEFEATNKELILSTIESIDLDEANIRVDAMLDMDKIWRNKIKEKIEEIKHKLTSKDFTHDIYIGTDKHIFWERLCAKEDVLEELLKGE